MCEHIGLNMILKNICKILLILILCIHINVHEVNAALTEDQILLINDISSQLNVSNDTFISIFISIENSILNSYEQQANETYNRSFIDAEITSMQYKIDQVNSTINIGLYNLLESFKNSTIENASYIAAESAASAIDSRLFTLEEETDERISSIKTNYVTMQQMDDLNNSQSRSLMIMSNAFSEKINNDVSSLWAWIFIVPLAFTLLSLFIVFRGGGVSLLGRRISTSFPVPSQRSNIETLKTAEDYKKHRKKTWELVSKVSNYTKNQIVREKLVKEIYDGVILSEEDLIEAANAYTIESGEIHEESTISPKKRKKHSLKNKHPRKRRT